MDAPDDAIIADLVEEHRGQRSPTRPSRSKSRRDLDVGTSALRPAEIAAVNVGARRRTIRHFGDEEEDAATAIPVALEHVALHEAVNVRTRDEEEAMEEADVVAELPSAGVATRLRSGRPSRRDLAVEEQPASGERRARRMTNIAEASIAKQDLLKSNRRIGFGSQPR